MFKFLKHPAELICKISVRNFSQTIVLSQAKSGSSSNLFKLRKSTGYALSKCKEALEKHSNNLEEVRFLLVISLMSLELIFKKLFKKGYKLAK